MKLFSATLFAAMALMGATPALAKGWQLTPAAEGHGLQLSYNAGETPAYLFECAASDVRVVNIGVTDLMDLQTGQKVPDAPGSVMTPGAAMMAIFTGKGQPDFQPAETAPNAVKGWDLTLRLAKTDKQLRALEKADMISLFTTGYTMAVAMDSESHALAKDFLKQCRAS